MKTAGFLFLLAFLLPLGSAPAQNLPDAPYMSATTVHNSPASFDHPRVQRSLDWRFISAHGIYASALVFDDLVTIRGVSHGCAEANPDLGPRPTGKQLAIHGAIEFAAVTAMDYLLKRTHVPGLSYVGVGIGTLKHVRGGVEWVRTNCL